eukprot:287808-Chlamydomonas_euryale.AAC.1
MQRLAPHMLTAHKGAISVSTSWMHQFFYQKLNWLFRTNKPKASQKKTAKAATMKAQVRPLDEGWEPTGQHKQALGLVTLSCTRLRRRPRPRPDDMMLD